MVLFVLVKVGDILLLSYGDSVMKCDSIGPSPSTSLPMSKYLIDG